MVRLDARFDTTGASCVICINPSPGSWTTIARNSLRCSAQTSVTFGSTCGDRFRAQSGVLHADGLLTHYHCLAFSQRCDVTPRKNAQLSLFLQY
jgi:hypothetical protein